MRNTADTDRLHIGGIVSTDEHPASVRVQRYSVCSIRFYHYGDGFGRRTVGADIELLSLTDGGDGVAGSVGKEYVERAAASLRKLHIARRKHVRTDGEGAKHIRAAVLLGRHIGGMVDGDACADGGVAVVSVFCAFLGEIAVQGAQILIAA